ncbi:MAG TPA: VTT domain-containing protein [Longimicrobiales bacterium]|nr:VTT domain-containing protein [Longimicrobiales bacterium]
MNRFANVWKWAALLLAVLALLTVGRRAVAFVPAFADWVAGQGVTGALVFAVVYACATVLLVPGSVLTLAAGAIFGIGRGAALVMIAATIGASAAFLIARYAARARVARRMQRDPRFAAIDSAIGASGWKIVVLLRLSPLFPFNLLNYALGLTSVRFLEYLAACVAMLPGTLLYVYYGRIIGDVAALASGAAIERGPAYYVLLGVGLVATIAVTVLITRLAQRELRRSAPDAI